MIETISFKDETLAIIVRAGFHKPGVHFFTPNDFSQQLAYMSHGVGKVIEPHVHNPVKREVHITKEVLLVRKGKLRVDFYDEATTYLESCVLRAGDIILLASRGHGFEVLEDLEMFEVKQGPYAGDQDKTRFQSVSLDKIRMKVN